MLSEQLKDLQLSIYDFIESQEFPPSETVAQVDEAPSNVIPSSDLDTRKNWEIVQDSLNEFFEKPTEDTDNKTLFSVGDVLTVRQASELYSPEDDPEDYFHLKDYGGSELRIILLRKNQALCHSYKTDKQVWFYLKELIK